jgi:nucleotide-binding universal stress UspA family protein
MYKHILIPTDGSPLSLKAVKVGARLAKRFNAKVTGLYVIPPYRPLQGTEAIAYSDLYSPAKYAADMRKVSGEAVGKVQRAAAAEKVSCEALALTERTPWEGIVKTARTKKCDLIVMASHGRRGLEGLLLGSETTKVLTHSKTPVLVCR